jgi:tripeptidyl-peptidase I
MFMLKVVAVAAIAAVSSAAPASIRHVMHEKRQTPSSDWVKVARIEGSAILPMRIGLTQSNLHTGHDLLMEVYVSNFLSN